MTKIPFLLFCGWGHAASTPFYYTLADNMYCHGGHIKEPSYLPNMEQYEYFDRLTPVRVIKTRKLAVTSFTKYESIYFFITLVVQK